MYREKMEMILQNYVFPLLNSPMGYLRARVGQTFSPDLNSCFVAVCHNKSVVCVFSFCINIFKRGYLQSVR